MGFYHRSGIGGDASSPCPEGSILVSKLSIITRCQKVNAKNVTCTGFHNHVLLSPQNSGFELKQVIKRPLQKWNGCREAEPGAPEGKRFEALFAWVGAIAHLNSLRYDLSFYQRNQILQGLFQLSQSLISQLLCPLLFDPA